MSEASAVGERSQTGLDIIRVRGLEKVYHVGDVDVPALRGVDLDVRRGEFLAVIGPSGSGKSTLFHILGGLAPPTAGHVYLDGVDLRGLKESERTEMRQKKVGFVFQKYNLLPTLTARDNIVIAQSLAGTSDWPPGFDSILTLLGIKHRLDHKPRALSGGEQQRVAIARALVNEPAILLADEPTGNLDTANSNAVLDILRDLNHRVGQTILMITHNPEAAAFADRTVTMRDGRIVGS
ncbi:MAG: ABC transporter ATP-binding protein [Acidobacteriaceae bacterium]|nr:ABC transporter ATP-binding protein [Acidobacteriaceae bacterium]MBV9781294.1 ABC transporter ATP-binding protein [Acidobacteriaceae bacterium]